MNASCATSSKSSFLELLQLRTASAMRIAIADVLPADDLETVHGALAQATFVDGRETAGFAARTVKVNQQAAASDRSLDTVRKIVADRILGNEVFRLAV